MQTVIECASFVGVQNVGQLRNVFKKCFSNKKVEMLGNIKQVRS